MSWVQLTIQEMTNGPNSYVVTATILATVGIDQELFVFATTDDQYSHVAVFADLQRYPAGKAAAESNGSLFYRASTVTREFLVMSTAHEFSDHVKARIAQVNREWGSTEGITFGGTETIVYDSETT